MSYLGDPARFGTNVPAFDVDLPPHRVLYSNSAGNLSLLMHNGITRIVAVEKGVVPLSPRQINATGTSVPIGDLSLFW